MYTLHYFLYSEYNNIAITFYDLFVTFLLCLMLSLVFSVSFWSLSFVILATNEGL